MALTVFEGPGVIKNARERGEAGALRIRRKRENREIKNLKT